MVIYQLICVKPACYYEMKYHDGHKLKNRLLIPTIKYYSTTQLQGNMHAFRVHSHVSYSQVACKLDAGITYEWVASCTNK